MCGGGSLCWSALVCLQFLGVREGWGFYGRWFFRRVSKIVFGYTIWFSFKWLVAANSLWILNLSSVFRWTPYLWQCSICMILFMGPKECASSLRCFAKLDVWLLLLNAFSCCLNRVAKRLPACPTYALLQSGQVSLYTADSENLSGVGFCGKVASL